jgi:RimJ/RimL family protein N-acetyltransferase
LRSRKFWGKGYATEAARRCIELSFNELGQDQVISLIEETNTRSIKVAERVGEKPDGMVVFEHAPEIRTLKYKLDKSDWRLASKR